MARPWWLLGGSVAAAGAAGLLWAYAWASPLVWSYQRSRRVGDVWHATVWFYDKPWWVDLLAVPPAVVALVLLAAAWRGWVGRR